MDRTGWIVVILCVLGLVGWEVYVAHQRQTVPPAAASIPAPALTTPTPAPPVPAASASSAAATRPPAPVASFAEQFQTLRNNDVELRLTNRGGGIGEAVLLNHMGTDGGPVRLNTPDHLPIGAIVSSPQEPDLPEFTFARTAAGVPQYEQTDAKKLTTRKTFAFPPNPLPKDNFVVNLEVEFTNAGDTALHREPYFVALGSAAPQHRTDYPTYTRLTWCLNGTAKGIDVNWFAAQNYPLVGVQKRPAQPFYTETFKTGADWAGVTDQFFATLITPLDAKPTEIWGRRTEMEKSGAAPTYAIEGAMGMPAFDLAPGEKKAFKYEIYAGPKLYARLAAMDHNQAEVMNFGLWKLVSQFLLNFMNLLHSWVGNYAAAIVILTIAIKGVLWPLQNRANASMRNMSTLSPKIQALREKHKDDPQRMNQAVMKLYKEHGVNPVGGCLPMLIQIPIFFGLLSMLGQAVELRNAKFLWVSDLSQPDTVAHFPGLGWPVNILPLCMALTNILLMRMTPKTGDPTQQRIMMFMPLIFLFFCYNFAAALALYYTTLNLLTVLQLYVNQRTHPLPAPAPGAAPAKARSKRR